MANSKPPITGQLRQREYNPPALAEQQPQAKRQKGTDGKPIIKLKSIVEKFMQATRLTFRTMDYIDAEGEFERLRLNESKENSPELPRWQRLASATSKLQEDLKEIDYKFLRWLHKSVSENSQRVLANSEAKMDNVQYSEHPEYNPVYEAQKRAINWYAQRNVEKRLNLLMPSKFDFNPHTQKYQGHKQYDRHQLEAIKKAKNMVVEAWPGAVSLLQANQYNQEKLAARKIYRGKRNVRVDSDEKDAHKDHPTKLKSSSFSHLKANQKAFDEYLTMLRNNDDFLNGKLRNMRPADFLNELDDYISPIEPQRLRFQFGRHNSVPLLQDENPEEYQMNIRLAIYNAFCEGLLRRAREGKAGRNERSFYDTFVTVTKTYEYLHKNETLLENIVTDEELDLSGDPEMQEFFFAETADNISEELALYDKSYIEGRKKRSASASASASAAAASDDGDAEMKEAALPPAPPATSPVTVRTPSPPAMDSGVAAMDTSADSPALPKGNWAERSRGEGMGRNF